ncbi:hypothetical protein T12_2112 [Trichinella patagoniensis]|uniref:Uncharacterized protein n=1 Tax=Trichinella patagoniensis TaxID=990121 RepID=A0A0V0Z9A2_9BILA|nr:hypothetical protein T12_2112 [Trichinella patagoniensis]
MGPSRGQRQINEQWDRMGTEVGLSGTIPAYARLWLLIIIRSTVLLPDLQVPVGLRIYNQTQAKYEQKDHSSYSLPRSEHNSVNNGICFNKSITNVDRVTA